MCNQIGSAIRREYTLGVLGAADGRYHSIRVLVNDPERGKLGAAINEPHQRRSHLYRRIDIRFRPASSSAVTVWKDNSWPPRQAVRYRRRTPPNRWNSTDAARSVSQGA